MHKYCVLCYAFYVHFNNFNANTVYKLNLKDLLGVIYAIGNVFIVFNCSLSVRLMHDLKNGLLQKWANKFDAKNIILTVIKMKIMKNSPFIKVTNTNLWYYYKIHSQ